jgi:hypothetical protein
MARGATIHRSETGKSFFLTAPQSKDLDCTYSGDSCRRRGNPAQLIHPPGFRVSHPEAVLPAVRGEDASRTDYGQSLAPGSSFSNDPRVEPGS